MPATPAPWRLSYTDQHFAIYSSPPAHAPEHPGSVICTSVIGDLPPDQNLANGELLVRAPQLLRVLVELMDTIPFGHIEQHVGGVAKAKRNAIVLLDELQKAGVL